MHNGSPPAEAIFPGIDCIGEMTTGGRRSMVRRLF